MPVKTIYVAVDETGNLGRSMKGERYYTLVACVVNDKDRFEFATKRYGLEEEIKFNTHEYLRTEILDYASSTVSEVFFVRYHKEKKLLNKFDQSGLHLDMIQALADSIVLRYGLDNDILVEVDHKDGISDGKVRNLFENNEYKQNFIICEILNSSESYGLQTNDFFVGAIGQLLNKSDSTYVRRFKSHPKESYLRSKNTKNQGEPASTT